MAEIHRLFHQLDRIREATVLIVVAGMEGALASVIGGLVQQPIIAVPTSVGYGDNFSGLSALLGMLTSCASGVTVVKYRQWFRSSLQDKQHDRIAGAITYRTVRKPGQSLK